MLTRSSLHFFFSLLYHESGLTLDESKKYLIETRLEPIAIQEGFSSIEEMGRHMRENPSPLLRQKIIDAMSTNETSFFRDIVPFEMLRSKILPEMMKENQKTRRIRIWSAGCSTGQEPYSIAISLCEMVSMLQGWDIWILATDMVEQVLGRARAGIYSQHEVQRGLPIAYLMRYFSQKGAEWEIKSEVKRFVEFRRLNFLEDFSSLGPFDIIFCRNVFIYFDASMKKKVMEQMARVLSRNGVILLGGAETFLGITTEFVRVDLAKGPYYKKNIAVKNDPFIKKEGA